MASFDSASSSPGDSSTDGSTDGSTNSSTDGRTDGSTDDSTDGSTDHKSCALEVKKSEQCHPNLGQKTFLLYVYI